MSSCFGRRKARGADTEPLLPRYEDDTVLQRRLHQKLHSYQILRALSKGYMPSTEQLIIILRSLLASDVLNPNPVLLSDSGRLLAKHAKLWLTHFIELLHDKNDKDQIQDFLWFILKARVSLDTQDLAKSASRVRAKADASAAYESVRTVGSLLLTNSDFRVLLSDLTVIGRQVFADTAFTLSDAAKDAGQSMEPSEQDGNMIKKPGSEPGPAPSGDDLQREAADLSSTVADGLARTGKTAALSAVDNVTGQQRETLLYRLKQAVLKLRKRNDYSDSVSTIANLLQRYAQVYSRAADTAVGTAQHDVFINEELSRTVKNFWSLLSSFGDKAVWDDLEIRFKQVMSHSQKDPEFETLVTEVGNFIQKMLTDPDFFESANDKIEELRQKSREVGSESTLRDDVHAFLVQIQKTIQTVINDADVSNLVASSTQLFSILSPPHAATNPELLQDSIETFLPLLIQAIQYIPIPRLEVSVPAIDLLLENLILEPGRTVNHTSFFPHAFRVQNYNDFVVRKAQERTATSTTTFLTMTISGLSLRADEVGFWFRTHSGLLRLADEGIASFHLDDRGIDITLEVEVGKDRLEKILSLRKVDVHIHHLSYSLRKSKFACLAWLLKPLLRPILRKTLEHKLATAIADGLHAANRELLYARERLRATRISDPQDVRRFIQAVITRLSPEPDPDLFMDVGVKAKGKGVFAGVYAPGSVVKLWDEEGRLAGETVDDAAEGGWRNEIFDTIQA
ncbi:MAG: hypothetical protein M4579_004909 [Chaenotheca gracillima]|nr:MAG: hypothetical protein M4579_004909 [Chaenotheca gracillima]